MLDCKANAMDVQEQLDAKADALDVKAQFADKSRFEQVLQRLMNAEQALADKCDVKRKFWRDD
jgi:uncharacterized protein YfcZ (UPF0381/DUF406 family)